jgi:hypothetical protein
MNSKHAAEYMTAIALKFWEELTADDWETVAYAIVAGW